MQRTPKGYRLHIAIFGRRNVGKSLILNTLTAQNVSIVSEFAGTTTDPVEKPMELLPLGPVVFLDTAGIDDVGALGKLRIERTYKVFDRSDVALVVTEADTWGEFEEKIVHELTERNIPFIVLLNKIDIVQPAAGIEGDLKARKIRFVETSAKTGQGADKVRAELVKIVPEDWINPPTIIGDLLPPGEIAILVVPIDLEAPKGRLILPQVQTLRDILDNDAVGVIVKERELRDVLANLHKKPRIVVIDSQVFLKASADVPPDVWLTSFSILFARFKGDLPSFLEGIHAIETLQPGDKVMICEACTHHPIGDDIGRVKIPRWLQQVVGGKLEFGMFAGRDFPDDISDYKLIVHCGACMWNRREMLSRIYKAKDAGVPITNYGMTIAYVHGILERALQPFPYAHFKYTFRGPHAAAAAPPRL